MVSISKLGGATRTRPTAHVQDGVDFPSSNMTYYTLNPAKTQVFFRKKLHKMNLVLASHSFLLYFLPFLYGNKNGENPFFVDSLQRLENNESN
jgi:hypothetical protein